MSSPPPPFFSLYFFVHVLFVHVSTVNMHFFEPAIFQCYLPQFVLYLCVCVHYIMFFCHFYSLFNRWLSRGCFSGKYVKTEDGE